MSTSDPHRPADDPVGPPDETVRPDETQPVEAVQSTPVATTEPTSTSDDLPPLTAEAAGEQPGAASTDDAGLENPSLDTGRHAVVRPVPVPPEAAALPVAAATPVVSEPPAPVVATPVAATPAVVGPPAPITPEPVGDDSRLFPDPNAPRSPSAGSHVLGVIVGLILGPIAIGALLLGESQVLDAQVDGWDATTDVLGIILVTLGLLLLGCILLLGLWTAAVPITSGGLLTIAGAVYLYAPSVARDQTLNILTSSGWRVTVTQVTVAGTSGMVLVAGFLLLLAGLVIASARKRGLHLGEFRERHKV